MRQFDVIRNPDPDERRDRPLLVVLQHDLHRDLASVVVGPLAPVGARREIGRLNPTVSIGQTEYFVVFQEIFPIARRRLGTAVANIEGERYRLLTALDLLFTGV